jgi:hypothetical protein
MKKLLVFILCFYAVFADENIGGFWKSLDDNGKPQCIFGIYQHNGAYYGRIIGTYDDDGVMRDTIYKPVSRSAGVIGNPHTCGLDIIYEMVSNGYRYAGKILDPSKGNVYNCEIWPGVSGQLIVRGKLLIFGKNIIWYAAEPSDFPKGFKLPDMRQFVPSIPQAN